MAFKSPPEIYSATIDAGEAKAIAVTSGLNPDTWGTLPQLFTGAAFAVGLMFVIIAGAELVTGNVPAVTLASAKGRTSWGKTGAYLAITTVGAFLGSIFVAYFLGVKTGILTGPDQLERLGGIATLKAHTETDWQIFLRGIGCNWLVCLAVWMALGASDIGGKILAIFFPIMAFVAMGFDHLVANMFFLPAAHWAGVPGIGWGDIGRNLLFAGLGNAVGAVLFVGCAYWFLYGRAAAPEAATETVSASQPAPEPAGMPVTAQG